MAVAVTGHEDSAGQLGAERGVGASGAHCRQWVQTAGLEVSLCLRVV